MLWARWRGREGCISLTNAKTDETGRDTSSTAAAHLVDGDQLVEVIEFFGLDTASNVRASVFSVPRSTSTSGQNTCREQTRSENVPRWQQLIKSTCQLRRTSWTSLAGSVSSCPIRWRRELRSSQQTRGQRHGISCEIRCNRWSAKSGTTTDPQTERGLRKHPL